MLRFRGGGGGGGCCPIPAYNIHSETSPQLGCCSLRMIPPNTPPHHAPSRNSNFLLHTLFPTHIDGGVTDSGGTELWGLYGSLRVPGHALALIVSCSGIHGRMEFRQPNAAECQQGGPTPHPLPAPIHPRIFLGEPVLSITVSDYSHLCRPCIPPPPPFFFVFSRSSLSFSSDLGHPFSHTFLQLYTNTPMQQTADTLHHIMRNNNP